VAGVDERLARLQIETGSLPLDGDDVDVDDAGDDLDGAGVTVAEPKVVGAGLVDGVGDVERAEVVGAGVRFG